MYPVQIPSLNNFIFAKNQRIQFLTTGRATWAKKFEIFVHPDHFRFCKTLSPFSRASVQNCFLSRIEMAFADLFVVFPLQIKYISFAVRKFNHGDDVSTNFFFFPFYYFSLFFRCGATLRVVKGARGCSHEA